MGERHFRLCRRLQGLQAWMSVKLHHHLAPEFSSCVAEIRVPKRNNVTWERFYFSCDYTEFKSIVAGKMGRGWGQGGGRAGAGALFLMARARGREHPHPGESRSRRGCKSLQLPVAFTGRSLVSIWAPLPKGPIGPPAQEHR